MTSDEQPSIPDVADRHRRLIAMAILALGLRYTVDALTYLVEPSMASSLEFVEKGFALLVVALIVPIFFWKARNLSSDEWHLYRDPDGFVATTIAQAQASSWAVTFIVLALMQALDRTLADFAWVFLFDVALAVMTLSFSAIYLYRDSTLSGGSEEAGHA